MTIEVVAAYLLGVMTGYGLMLWALRGKPITPDRLRKAEKRADSPAVWQAVRSRAGDAITRRAELAQHAAEAARRRAELDAIEPEE